MPNPGVNGLEGPGNFSPWVSAPGTRRGYGRTYALVYVETQLFIGFQWLKMFTVRNDILLLLMSFYS